MPSTAPATTSSPLGADVETPPPGRWSRWRPKVPRYSAWFARLVVLLAMAGVLLPEEIDARLDAAGQLLPLRAQAYATATVVAASLLILLMANGLTRRKRRAWQLMCGLLAVNSVVFLVRGVDLLGAVASLSLLLLLLAARAEFYALPDPSSRWVALRVLVTFGSGSALIGFLVVLRYSHTETSTLHAAEHTLLGLVGVGGPARFPTDHASDVATITLATLGLLTLLFTAVVALKTPEPSPRQSPEDVARLRTLLERHGDRDSLGYFALRSDKAVVFSPSGKAAVAYRPLSGVSLAGGDPIGDPEAWPQAIEAWLHEARRHAWTPAVLGASEPGATAYHRAGLEALELGDEAILCVGEFSLEGRSMRVVRQAVNRVTRAGYTVRCRRVGEVDPQERAAIRAAADGWRDGEAERGFSMALSRTAEDVDPGCVLVTCLDPDGELCAVLQFVPWGSSGLSLDLMRRSRDSENGLIELMVSDLVLRAAPDLGVERISLNFAVFRSALERGARIGAGPITRAWRHVLLFASRWWQIEALYRANVKFRPDWEPRFVCFQRARDLPRVALAAAEAEAFLERPRLASVIPFGRRG